MTGEKKYKWKKWLSISAWTTLGVLAIVLLVSAIERKYRRVCKGVEVEIQSGASIFFVDKADVLQQVKQQYPELEKTTVEGINLGKLETRLRKNVWISNAELFFDNNDVLQVKLWEREPIARIITVNSSSFYLDSSGRFIPLTDKFSARVPVFTNFPVERVLSRSDSALLNDIKVMSDYILHDPFWMAQVSQVDITPAGTFEIIPSIGNHIILFGDGSNCRQKFHRLLTFYKEVPAKTGLNTYSVIHAGYDQQIVAVRKDKAARMADSAQAISLMKTLSSSVNRMLMDSLAVIDPAITDPVITTPAAADTGQTNKKIVRTISPSKTVLMKTTPVKTIVKPKAG